MQRHLTLKRAHLHNATQLQDRHLFDKGWREGLWKQRFNLLLTSPPQTLPCTFDSWTKLWTLSFGFALNLLSLLRCV